MPLQVFFVGPICPHVGIGGGSLTHENAQRPLTAKEGVAYFKEQALQWRSHIERLDEEGLAGPVGEPMARWPQIFATVMSAWSRVPV